MKTPAIIKTLELSEGRRLVLCRREGKRSTTVQIDKPIHETAGITFVNVLAHRKLATLKQAESLLTQWAAQYS